MWLWPVIEYIGFFYIFLEVECVQINWRRWFWNTRKKGEDHFSLIALRVQQLWGHLIQSTLLLMFVRGIKFGCILMWVLHKVVYISWFSSNHHGNKRLYGLCFGNRGSLNNSFYKDLFIKGPLSPRTKAMQSFINVVIWRKVVHTFFVLINSMEKHDYFSINWKNFYLL